MTVPPVVHRSLALFALLAAAGCATRGAPPARNAAAPATPAAVAPLPPIALQPADGARGRVALSLVVAAPAHIEGDLATVAGRLHVPFDPAVGLLDLLAGGPGVAGVPITRAAMARIDSARALAAVGLVKSAGMQIELCAAIPFRDADGARRTLEELGVEEARRDGAALRRLPNGQRVWAALGDRTLFLSKAEGAIQAGGALALERLAGASTAPLPGAAVLELYPQPFGPSLPLVVSLAAQSGLQKAAADKYTDGSKPSKAMMAALEEVGHLLTLAAGQTRVMRVALQANEADGLAFHIELAPLPGSAFAKQAAIAGPYALDDRLPVDDDRAAVFSWGTGGPTSALIADLADKSGPAGHALAGALAKFSDDLKGPGSCAIRFSMPMQTYCAWPLRPGVRPADVMGLYSQMIQASGGWGDAVGGKGVTGYKVRRHGAIVEIEEVLPPDTRKAAQATRRVAFGGDARESALTVKDGRLLIAQGPKPRELLAAFGEKAAPATQPGPLLTGSLAHTRGANAFAFIDVLALIIQIASASDDPSFHQLRLMVAAIPGLKELRAPLVMAIRNGPNVELELQVPTATLENIARIVQPFMGTMGASAAGH